MGFFDLNIPYHESDRHITDKSTLKTTRLKLIIKAMELGYTGVAYNRTVNGVMSESIRCSTSRPPLSSLLKLSPALSSAVKFHRDILKVPLSTPFRQYTRLTVIIDSAAQASALNSSNSILKSYDIVAVCPLNQLAFEQACQASEVDLIAIDLSAKQFRLGRPMIQAAIRRGVYFEITYSGLLKDPLSRKQMISNAKLLVDWTRGKNFIISSAAPSVTELRGPYDVANLSSLLGLPMERAKVAISKNCRSLIVGALRRKHFYKEAIRVEVISSGAQVDSKEAAFDDWLKWDPISSGDGDLLLDDMANSFSVSSKVSKTVKAIDFASVMDSLPSHGLQIKDLISVTEAVPEPPNIGKKFSTAEEIEVPAAVYGLSEQPDKHNLLPEGDWTSWSDSPVKHKISICEDLKVSLSPNGTLEGFTNAKEIGTLTASTEEEPKMSNGLDVYFSPIEMGMHDLPSQNYIAGCEERRRPDSIDVVSCKDNVATDEVFIETDVKSKDDMSLDSCGVSFNEGFPERDQFGETRDGSITLPDGFSTEKSHDEMRSNNDYTLPNDEPQEKVTIEEQKQVGDHTRINYPILDESISGKGRVNQRAYHPVFSFSLKQLLLHRVAFKKKARKFKNKL